MQLRRGFPLPLIAALFVALIGSASAAQPKLQRDMALWYAQPAEKWPEAMPMGNGLMGVMVFGGTQHERIALNEGTFWSGRPHDYNNPGAGAYFPQIRDLVFTGKFQEAEKMANDHFFGVPAAQQAFQPLGDLLLTFDGAEKAENYRRELDLETGVAKITYRVGDISYTREIFVSYPDRVMALRISADKPGSVSVEAHFASPYLDSATANDGKLVMDGTWKGPIPIKNWLIAPVEGKGIQYRASLLARPEGGKIADKGDALRVESADAVTFILAIGTSFINYHDISGDAAAACDKSLAAAVAHDYAGLRQSHVEDFSTLMDRVHLEVGDKTRNEKAIPDRLEAAHAGERDPNLEGLAFQFGRYLLVSSSRAGGQPANLQGIWNDAVSPPWGSKYTININTEMNYWPTEVCNLSECHQPMFDMLEDISANGAETAKLYYGCGGWVTHHNLDLWRGTAPVDAARFGMWPMGGAWLCQDIWERYAFTGDEKFLAKYYPVLKGAAEFFLQVMVEEPKHHWLVTPFSMSPEHGYLDDSGNLSFLSPAPTMDVAILRELFPHCLEAAKKLGVDEEFRGKLEAALKRLPPYQINRLGCIQEWIEDWRDGGQGHNCSPNFTFFPGSSITLRGTPQLSGAIQKWMELHPARGGFIISWDSAVWARLERGDKVGEYAKAFVERSLAPNMHNRGANQSDASFGFTAAIAEALLQSHAGEISFLPALPTGWADGSVRGLRARGGYEVGIDWKDGKLQSAMIRSIGGKDCKVRSWEKTAIVKLAPGEVVRLDANLSVSKVALAGR